MSVIYLNSNGNGANGLLFNFDFTDSLVDSINGVTATASSITQNSDGAYFAAGGKSRLAIPIGFAAQTQYFTIEIDVGACDMASGANKRFLMWDTSTGFVYKNADLKWSCYNGGSWKTNSDISDINYIANSTIKFEFTSTTMKVYKDNTLFYTVECGSRSVTSTMYIGSSDSSSSAIANVYIKALRVYINNFE